MYMFIAKVIGNHWSNRQTDIELHNASIEFLLSEHRSRLFPGQAFPLFQTIHGGGY